VGTFFERVYIWIRNCQHPNKWQVTIVLITLLFAILGFIWYEQTN